MTTSKLTPWTTLLSRRFSDVTEEYGPNSQAVVCALEAMDDTHWLQRVGEPWLDTPGESFDGNRVMVVKSWEDHGPDEVENRDVAGGDPAKDNFARISATAWYVKAHRQPMSRSLRLRRLPRRNHC